MVDIVSPRPFFSQTFTCSVCHQDKKPSEFHMLHNPRHQWVICKQCALVGKHCSRCGEYQSFEAFPKGANSVNRGGVAAYCKKCKGERSKERYCPERQRRYNLHAHFRITQEDYDLMLFQQAGVCAICCKPETARSRQGKILPLAIDHDHTTGEIRQLLCLRCNKLLGHIENNRHVTHKILRYLQKHDS